TLERAVLDRGHRRRQRLRGGRQCRVGRESLRRRLSETGPGLARHQPVRVSTRRRHAARFSRRSAHVPVDPAHLPAGAGDLHARRRAAAPGRRHEEPAMTRPIVVLTLAGSVAVAGCGGSGQAAVTSFSANERPDSRAELFTLPENQMARVQIYTVASAPLARVLRLTGTVAYNGFLTTPVISQVGGPVSRILVTPGQHVKTGQPLLYVASPDFSLLRSGYIKAKDAFELAEKID